ncbi:MAG: hypothetical protein KatS3mg061_1838 [Dehalococcoidia bacterium]|nr:MAG: hypothetical protein KatS3mg061_1838 [Dehalococcoidia bacterium]
MAEAPRAVAERIVAAVERGGQERGLGGRWVLVFPPGSSDFEVRGEGLRLIVEVNRGLSRAGLARLLARWFQQGPVEARLRAWFLNEFVERSFAEAEAVVPVLLSILEAHRPAGPGAPTAVTGAPELDSPERPSVGADD